ncbi:MAG TPA: 50S ribosomal protein L29 [Elusimicrobiales bacterium]|nr:50S ribosomal protein L29 [Elusimicrobiales bacterium]HOL61867.1 50S ribosomal protein L29 [Elusimicrobiales bacterium]HPO95085.1 50S ribosomal protein L29 [Elusimicrobiales bacterium]
MGDNELNAMLKDLEKELFELKFNKKISPLDNPLKIRILRRKIAFVKTILSERNNKTVNISKE